jgi:hypothetical protein
VSKDEKQCRAELLAACRAVVAIVDRYKYVLGPRVALVFAEEMERATNETDDEESGLPS